VAYDDGGPARRAELMRELRRINAALARLDVPARVPTKMVRRYSTEELEVVVAGARRHWLMVVYQLGGTA